MNEQERGQARRDRITREALARIRDQLRTGAPPIDDESELDQPEGDPEQ